MLHDTRVSIRLTPGSHATQHPGVRYDETRVSYKFLLHQKKSSLPYYLKFTYTDIFSRFTAITSPPADYSQSRIIFKQIDI